MHYIIYSISILSYRENTHLWDLKTRWFGEIVFMFGIFKDVLEVCFSFGFFFFVWWCFIWKLLLLFFVECRPGSYGFNCSLNCSSYCEEKDCDRYSGECLHGCTPGYQKPDCVTRKIYIKLSCFALLMHCAITKKSQ